MKSEIEALFQKYKDKDASRDCIGPDGVAEICNDIGISPTSVCAFTFQW